MKRLRRATVERSERPAGGAAERGTADAASVAADTVAYRQVGDDVAEVLTAAERTAARIRESALEDAERIRADAEKSVAATLADAKARRAEADEYSQKTRAAAEAYAEATRRKNDEEAASRVSKAKEQAREIRAQAEKKARELEADAIRNRDELMKKTEGMEDRIKTMLNTFREATTDLEELLPDERPDAAERIGPASERPPR